MEGRESKEEASAGNIRTYSKQLPKITKLSGKLAGYLPVISKFNCCAVASLLGQFSVPLEFKVLIIYFYILKRQN